jgi:hypothetical protein
VAEGEIAPEAAVDRLRSRLAVLVEPAAQVPEELVGGTPVVGGELLGGPPQLLDLAVLQPQVASRRT